MSGRYKQICKQFKCHSKVFIKMPADFENKIGRPDLVVVFTNAVSHNMVRSVKKQSDKHNFKVEHINSAGAEALKEVLRQHCSAC